jgi:hypothetical protein
MSNPAFPPRPSVRDLCDPAYTPASKPSNPKDAIGSDKVPYHLWPETASILGALALLDGMLKYGRANWRAVGVRASIYYDALRRHMNKWFEGEDIDPDSGLPHLAHMLACCAILVDAQAAGKMTDDRQYPGAYVKLLAEMTPHVKRLKEKYADCDPHHYTRTSEQVGELVVDADEMVRCTPTVSTPAVETTGNPNPIYFKEPTTTGNVVSGYVQPVSTSVPLQPRKI